jgi:hypothetical protein
MFLMWFRNTCITDQECNLCMNLFIHGRLLVWLWLGETNLPRRLLPGLLQHPKSNPKVTCHSWFSLNLSLSWGLGRQSMICLGMGSLHTPIRAVRTRNWSLALGEIKMLNSTLEHNLCRHSCRIKSAFSQNPPFSDARD